MVLNRRTFLRVSGASLLLAAGRARFAHATLPTLPAPDFSYREGETRFIAGLRPYREQTYRLETEAIGEKYIVHNYGYGGAGITMSWGCAYEVLDHITALDGNKSLPVAILGAGALGLTAALVLVEAGFKPRIYAKEFLEGTTSHIAGGQWAPSTVAYGDDSASIHKFERILRRAFRAHESRITKGYGVKRIDNYTESKGRVFNIVPRDLIPEPILCDPSPLMNHQKNFCYQTLLVEPPIFLRRLEVDLREAGVWLRKKEFNDMTQVCGLEETLIINCMGLGSGRVCADPLVKPIKGQLVLLKPQLELDYLYSGRGYIFPRRDAVVVGGSFEEGNSDPTPEQSMCQQILAYARAGFEADKLLVSPPEWMLQDRHL